MTHTIFNEQDGEYVGDFLFIREQNESLWTIENKDPELVGHLEKIRVGAWMSWCLTLEEGCYLSASCQDEVREVTRILNSQTHNKTNMEGKNDK